MEQDKNGQVQDNINKDQDMQEAQSAAAKW